MNRLDRYIFFRFLGSFFLFLGLVMMIAVVFDISQKVDNFINNNAAISKIIGDYYINFLAFYGTTFSSLIVFLSTIFVTGRMARDSEIVAALTGGVSFPRLIKPFLFGALVLFIGNSILSHFVIPKTNIARIHFEDTYVQDKIVKRPINIHRQILPDHYIYIETWSPERQGGYHFSYERFENDRMIEKLMADFVRYDTAKRQWQVDNWTLRTWLKSGKMTLERGRRIDTSFAFDPTTISPDLRSTSTMTSPELLKYLKRERISGSEAITSHEMEWHKRIAYPFSVFILVFIAVVLSSEKRRGGIGGQIAIGLLIAVIYIFFMQLGGVLVSIPIFNSFMAIWLPNFLFTILGAVLYIRAVK